MKRIFLWICIICMLSSYCVVSVSAEDNRVIGAESTDFVKAADISTCSADKESLLLDSGQCGENLFWELNSDGVLRIYGEGAMYDYNKYFEPSPWYKYRDEPFISEDGANILDKDGAIYLPATDYFANNPNGYKVKEIVIESGVTYIGDWAFYRVCVEEITVPETVEAVGIFCFRYSPTLKKLTLPNSLKVLDDYAISRNYELETINIGNSLETVGVAGFNNNPALKQLILPETCTTINVQQSPAYANIDYSKVGLMENCISLEFVSFGRVNNIPQRTCLNTALESVFIPNTVEYIGDYAFYTCTNLRTVVFEEGSVCKMIANNSFASCTSLESIKGGVSLEKLGVYTSISSLVDFDFSSTNTTFEKQQFAGTSLKEIRVSDRVTTIPVSCFNGMQRLEKVYLPGTLSEICASSFNYCPSLKDIYYDGTFQQWFAVKKASGWIFKADADCKVHFNDGTSVSAWYTPKSYTVTFVDVDGTVIDVQKIVEGYGAYPPDVPEKEGYAFVGWNTDFDCVTSDITVTALYEEIVVPIVPKMGKLKIELIGGTTFTIAVDGGNTRPQGTYYQNTKILVGTRVTVIAGSTSNAEFYGWMNESGALVSAAQTYTFVTSGNDTLKALYLADVVGVNSVMFINSKAAGGKGQILSMQYYVAGDEICFPAAPTQSGYDFAGWSMTEAEIQTALANNEDVTVTAIWTVAKKYVTITVNGGELTAGNLIDGKALAYNAYTVSADAPEDGKKFAYWADATGKIMSYSAQYKFFPAADTVLTAMYVAEDVEIEYKALAFISADPTTEGEKITYIMSWDTSYVGEVISAGLMVVNEIDYNPLTFKHGSGDSKIFDRAFGTDQIMNVNTYSIGKSDSFYDNTYVACIWIVYKNANGVEHTVYSDIDITYKPAP